MEPQKEPHPNYLPYPPQSQPTDDEIDLRELFKALWKGKWIIVATTFVFTISSVLYALSLPNVYKSDALLAPTETSNGGGLAKMAGQLGGLAALAGVNLASNETSQTDLAIEVMKSRKFIYDFITKHDLLVPVMAAKGWDLKTNELKLDLDIYDPIKKEWLREPNGLRNAKPSAQEAAETFKNQFLNVSQNKVSGLYTVTINFYSPYLAQEWVGWLIEDINTVMRERSIKETKQNLLYLNEQLEKTSIADMKSTFYKLIEEQTKTLMLAEVQDEYIFKTIDPAVTPELKSEPKRFLICIFGITLGLLIGGIISIIKFRLLNYK
ncbi:TPA: LPS O-antigen length regulator [Vibrio parahaemolyticus]|uniref:Wzz/FepE/Etk N-terminal domain-containing protein n=1 Tax=Vibrio parahaemolyticus TaxID=670 RepID=UPI00079FEBB5|nr:Wzz/FepE/Etk N-terminal domain-containing protein [Vibrio parahaemolyticus]EGQ9349962.1 LPS O-antigen length regulator [Vibrio parahaemolyticus]EGQ9513931.1 LPS O-antigen length regulator [Vibrio parahaemolyticus]EIM7928995.1 LPS O-antigen length regulator [Vibrio parahaemolyticus]EJC7014965.1 LPS O-antigen length regulator [Vibrio parahaemolyticus]EJQ8018397.1 LPS O-antigen length regulator [Vibrio parahaemolyticus]